MTTADPRGDQIASESRRARIVLALLRAFLVLCIVALPITLLRGYWVVSILERSPRSHSVGAFASIIDGSLALVSLFRFVAFASSAIFFTAWILRARRVASRWMAPVRSESPMLPALVAIVPALLLVVLYRGIKRLSDACDPDVLPPRRATENVPHAGYRDAGLRERPYVPPGSAPIRSCILVFIATLMAWVVTPWNTTIRDTTAARENVEMSSGVLVAWIVSSLLCLRVVRSIHQRLEERALRERVAAAEAGGDVRAV